MAAAKTHFTAFAAEETVEIVGMSRDCECSHCGRPLKVGVKLSGFGGVFGSDCLSKAFQKQKSRGYVYKLSAEGIKTRAIVAHKGQDYARRVYGWDLGSSDFKVALKSELRQLV